MFPLAGATAAILAIFVPVQFIYPADLSWNMFPLARATAAILAKFVPVQFNYPADLSELEHVSSCTCYGRHLGYHR
jgi:hypothetical protein